MERHHTLSKERFRYIESEVRIYHDTLLGIKRIRDDIINATPEKYDDGIKLSTLSDPTGNRATMLATYNMLRHMEKFTDAISAVYETLPPEKQTFLRIYYWKKPQTLTLEGVAQQLYVTRRTVYEWRREIVYDIADILGMIIPK